VTQHYEIEVGGRLRRIGVAKSGDGFAVTLDNRTIQVDVARGDAHTMSLICHTPAPRSYEVALVADPGSPAQFTVRVGAVPVAVSVNNGRRSRRNDDHSGSPSGPQRITAPMPGKIVRVLVKPGDAVRARQPLVVVEAMKMENELRAARDGVVRDVEAREGQSVDAGVLLVLVQ
jgi:biotin carboxyl carrier protein